MQDFFLKLKHTLEMIKFSHSVFALPFALASYFQATQGIIIWQEFVFIILCMITARNTAMAFNRLVDHKIDAKNPRTLSRHIPAGLLSKNFVLLFIIVNAALFILFSYLINPLCFLLSPLALIIVCFYSLTKRFTSFTQLFLGLALGVAPIAAWIAATGKVSSEAVILGGAVLFWVAGFDLIYAMQDHDFDKKEGLKSLVVRLGLANALLTSRLFHLLTIALLFLFGNFIEATPYYFGTLILVGLSLAYEQSLVSSQDLSKVNAAFFTVNGFVALLFLAGNILDVYSR